MTPERWRKSLPDGRYLAYESDESDDSRRPQVHLRRGR
jgi:hypothetical protein